MAWKNADESMNGFINIGGVSYDIKDGLIEGEFGSDQLGYLKNDPAWSEVADKAPKAEKAPAPKKKAAAKKKA